MGSKSKIKGSSSSLAIGIIVAIVLAIVMVGFYLYPFIFHNRTVTLTKNGMTPNNMEVYNALTTALGDSYRVMALNGTDANGLLVFGSVKDPILFINYSSLYYIQKSSLVKVYPPGSTQYWGNLSYDLAVLRLVPAKYHVASAVLMNTTGLDYTGGNYTLTLIGTFSHGSSVFIPSYPADGYTVMMFVTPPRPPVNNTVNDTLEASNIGMEGWPVKLTGEIYYPYSTTPYIVVQWDPYWHEVNDTWTTGEFNVWVVHPMSSGTLNDTSIKLLVGGGGNGYIKDLKPGDLIEMEVTYDGSDNTVYAKVVNLNSSSAVTLALPLYSNFTVPHAGGYWTEVNAGTGNSYWNWGLVYLSAFNNVYVEIEKG